MRHAASLVMWALAAGLIAGPVNAEEAIPLDGETVRLAVTGRTLSLETRIGPIPITFRPDGSMIGRSADLANWLGRSMDQGQWWIENDQLCQRWKLWLDGKAYCFTLHQIGEKVQWTRNDGLKGMLVVRAQ